MEKSALAIQSALAAINVRDVPRDVLQAQVNSFAFLTQSRVRIYDEKDELVADSGEFEEVKAGISFASLPSSKAAAGGASGGDVILFQAGEPGVQIVQGNSVEGGFTPPPEPLYPFPQAGAGRMVIYQLANSEPTILPVFTTFLATGPADWDEEFGARSRHTVELPLIHQTKGRLVVSDGPAYGRQIVDSVAEAWAVAGLLAVVLAGAAGWLASQRITQPVLALSAAARRMAAGDLSARVGKQAGVEFGALSSAFDEMAAKVETTIVTLRRFAADAAHELKTPLTALRTDLELAQTEIEPEREAALILRAQEQVLSLDQLTSGLLDLSRLETGLADMEMERVDLAALARQVCEPYAARAEQTGQVFALDLPSAPAVIAGDPRRLALAIRNLLENALKFTPPDGKVYLKLEVEEGRARLVVEDSGIGIPEQDLPLLFGRFHRGRNATGYPGSGLGLAIVRAVAEAHGGTVHAANLPDGGAKVWIEFTSPGG